MAFAALGQHFPGFPLLLERQNLRPYDGLDRQPKAQVFLADAQSLLAGIAHLTLSRGGTGIVQRCDNGIGDCLSP